MEHNSRRDVERIWRAGVDAVRSDRLVAESVSMDGPQLQIGDDRWTSDSIRHLAVVGAGKAGAGMAQGLETALGPTWLSDKLLSGWINVPADCVRPLQRIHLHAARPAGINEPTEDGVSGANQILQIVGRLDERDLCLCLISGGGSALLPAPRPGISLADLQQVTRQLSARGATIEQLNAVRKRLSRIQGGGLARACRAGHLVTLIISDVMGDPLPVIASGPTVLDPDPQAARELALQVFDEFDLLGAGVAGHVRELLRLDVESVTEPPPSTRISNRLIGNNDTATAAAAAAARALGYDTRVAPPQGGSSTAEEVGQQLAAQLLTHLHASGNSTPGCLISGGEPVVRLAPAETRGQGGRNQQLVLASLEPLRQAQIDSHTPWALLSGGTDGEDGPTDAAGAVVDAALLARVHLAGLEPRAYLSRNDAYSLFDQVDGLLRTGPTDTNVCDVRVVVWGRPRGTA